MPPAIASEESEAAKQVALAISKNKKVEKMFKELKDKYLNKTVEKYGAWTLQAGDMIIKQEYKVQYEWKF